MGWVGLGWVGLVFLDALEERMGWGEMGECQGVRAIGPKQRMWNFGCWCFWCFWCLFSSFDLFGRRMLEL